MTTPNQIVKELRPQCRHCHRRLNLKEVVEEMFVGIARKLAAGERVELPGIGILHPKAVRDRVIRTVPHKQRRLVPGWVEVNFRASFELKQLLNPNRPKSKPMEEPNAKRPATKQRARKRRARPGRPSDG